MSTCSIQMNSYHKFTNAFTGNRRYTDLVIIGDTGQENSMGSDRSFWLMYFYQLVYKSAVCKRYIDLMSEFYRGK